MKKYIIAVIMLFILSSVAYATDDNPEIHIDNENKCVVISGILEDARAGYNVGIRIRKSGDDEYSYIEQVKTGKNPLGGYSFTFFPEENGGIYISMIYLPDEDKTIEKKFAYYSSEAVCSMIDELNNSENKEDVEKLVIDNNIAFGITDEVLEKFSDKGFVSEGILNYLNAGNKFSDIEDVGKITDKLLLMDIINNSKEIDFSGFESFPDSYTYSLIGKFEEFSGEKIKKRIEEKKDFKNPVSFDNELRECVILGIVESLNGFGDVAELLENTAEYTGIDIEGYRESTKKSQIMKSVTGISYKSFEELKKDFNNAVDVAKNKTQNNGGGSSGGGGHNGSGYVVTPPSVPADSKDNSMQNNINTEKEMNFKDVESTHWAFGYISKLYKKGVINGKSEDVFDLHGNVTREEFVKMIVLAMDYDVENQESNFEDVSKDSWFYPYVSCAKNNNIVNGVSDTDFGVGTDIKRQDMFVIIYRVLQSKNKADAVFTGQMPFEDASEVSDYAKNALEIMYKMGILKGNGTKCNPYLSATRAEAAKVICEMMEKGV